MTDMTEVFSFLDEFEDDSFKLSALKRKYADLVHKLEEDAERDHDARLQAPTSTVEELQAMVADYRRDNVALETNLRAAEKSRETLHSLVVNLKSRLGLAEAKISMVTDIFDIDAKSLTADNYERLKKEFAWLRRSKNKSWKKAGSLRKEPLLDDSDEGESGEEGAAGDGDSELSEMEMSDRARAVVQKHKRESEYLRQECQALEDELRSTEEILEEKVHSCWEREVVALLEDMDSDKLSKYAQSKGHDFVEWKPHTGDDIMDSVQARLHRQISTKLHSDQQQSGGKTAGGGVSSESDATKRRGSVPLSGDDMSPQQMQAEMDELVKAKVRLVEECASGMEAMRDMLRSYSDDYKYRRLLDRMLDDNKYKKLLDRLAEESDDEADNEDDNDEDDRAGVENDLNELLGRINHLKERRMSRAQFSVLMGGVNGPTGFGNSSQGSLLD